nr:hypothetical protein [Tanacetum cinerariifolium]
MHLRSEPLSTFYLLMTSESSLDSSSKRLLDSSSPSVGPSCKRCRSPTTLVSSSTLVPRSIAPALADFLPRKRFMDSYSFEASGEEHMEIGTADVETVVDLGISEGVGALTKDGIGDAPDLEGTLYDIAHYMLEVPLDRINEFETTQRQLEAGQLVASEERASLADRVRSLGWENLRVRALLCIERDHVNSLRHHMALSQEEFCQIRKDRDDTRRRLRRTMTNTRSGMTPAAIKEMINRRNGNENHNENDRDARPVMESKLWNLTMKNNDFAAYTQRFQELTMLCTNMVLEEEDRVGKFIGGYAMKNVENKRKFDNNQKDSHRQQPPFKRQNVARAYMAGNNEKRVYNGPLPLYNKCKFHHEDQNHGNKTGNKSEIGEERGKAYVLGGRDANPDSNVIIGTFLLNNHYAYVLFDLGADQSFVSTTLSTLLDIIPDTLDVSYVVELADGRVFETNIVLRGCMLGLLGHPFNIDLMPVELGSFDVIIGMD